MKIKLYEMSLLHLLKSLLQLVWYIGIWTFKIGVTHYKSSKPYNMVHYIQIVKEKWILKNIGKKKKNWQ